MEKCLYCYKPLKMGQIDYHLPVPENSTARRKHLSYPM